MALSGRSSHADLRPSTGNVGQGSPAMRISRSTWPGSAFCDSFRLTFRSRSRGEVRLSPQVTHCRLSCRSSKPHRPQKFWHFRLLPTTVCYMKTIVMILVAFVRKIVLSCATLQLENIALRQQVAVLKRERPMAGASPTSPGPASCLASSRHRPTPPIPKTAR
jgi:hypothetical protein